jgi:hypothetical protein
MPGGRLTQEERHEIAGGLAGGLTYTEIAARLGRPVSTVTREVSRNGGPREYQAERAHEATGARARRSKGAARPSAPSASDGRDREALRALAERLTETLVETGLPRTTARVLVALHVTDSGSATAAELARGLRLSPASISKAVGQLECQALIRRERDSRRRDRYVIDGDIWYQSWLASVRRNVMIADIADGGVEVLGPETPAGARMREMGLVLRQVSEDMIAASERWRA